MRAIAIVAIFSVALSLYAANNHALIIQAFHPEEGLDFYSEDKTNALWNDTYLMFELLDTAAYGRLMKLSTFSPERIHLLYANGTDWRPASHLERYSPARRLGLQKISDDTASKAKVERYMRAFAYGDHGLGIDPMTPNDTLFIYTWGHGDHDGPHVPNEPSRASHFFLQVRPIRLTGNGTEGDSIWDTTFARMADVVNGRLQGCGVGI